MALHQHRQHAPQLSGHRGTWENTLRVPRRVPRRRGRLNPCHRCRCRPRRRRTQGPGASWPVTAGAGLARGGGVSAAVGGPEVRRIPSLKRPALKADHCRMLSRITYLRGNLHRTDLAGCRGGRREHERSSRSRGAVGPLIVPLAARSWAGSQPDHRPVDLRIYEGAVKVLVALHQRRRSMRRQDGQLF